MLKVFVVALVVATLASGFPVFKDSVSFPLNRVRAHARSHNYFEATVARREGKLPPIGAHPLTHEIVAELPTIRNLSWVPKNVRGPPIVPMVNYADEIWVATIGLGSPAQPLRVVMDTGSSNLWVPSAACPLVKMDLGCVGKHKYNHSDSSTYLADSCEPLFILYGTGFMLGYISNDTVSLGGVKIPQCQFGEALWMADFFEDTPIDGILGLGFQEIASDSIVPVFDRMIQEKIVSKALFTTFLSNTVGGKDSTIIFGEIDQSYCDGGKCTFAYADVLLPSYWLVSMDNLYVGNSKVHNCDIALCPTVVDTGTSIIVGPPYVLDSMIKAIGPVYQNCSNLNSLPTISFEIGGVQLPVPPSIYVLRVDDGKGKFECLLGIESSDAVVPLTILGDPFLRAYYTVFDREQYPPQVGFAKAKNWPTA